jgi:AraC family ethanolamine operon transcriptional activator
MDAFNPFSLSTLHTCDIDELAEAAKDWQQEYQQLSLGKFQAQSWAIQFGDMELSLETANQIVGQVGTVPSNDIAAALFCAPRGATSFCGQALQPDQLAFANGDENYTVQIPPDYQLLTLKVNRLALEAYADRIEDWSMGNQLQGKQLKQLTPAQTEYFKQLIVTTWQQAIAQPAWLSDGQVQQTLSHRLLEYLVTLAREVDESPVTLGPSRYQTMIDACCDYLNAHATGLTTVETLCQVCGVSRRTLQTSFHKILGVSPGQYLKIWRLNQVHQALKQSDPQETTVAAMAHDWGFFHLGHFSRSYQKQFGARPSTTLRQ